MVGSTALDPRWRAVREDGSDYPRSEYPSMITLRTGEPQSRGDYGNPGTQRGTSAGSRINSRAVHSVPGEHGGGVAVVSFIDVTQRRQAEAELVASRESYRLLAQHSTDLIVQVTADGLYSYVSPACQSLLGYTPQEMIGRPVRDFIHADDWGLHPVATAVMSETPGPRPFLYRKVRKDGSPVWVETLAQRLPRGKEQMVCVVRDVSQRRQLENQRDHFFTLSLDMLCIATFEGYFIQLNPAWEQTLGYDIL